MRNGAALALPALRRIMNSAAENSLRILPNRMSVCFLRAHTGERIDLDHLMGLLASQCALGSTLFLHRSNRIENDPADQNHAFIRCPKLLLAPIEQRLR